MTQDAADFPPVDLPPTDQSLPIALLRARERLMIPIREALQVTGLTEQQWRLLRVLEEFGPQDATKLAERARDTLAELGYGNVQVREADGYAGWQEQAPFDAIMVTAAPDHVPQPLVDQLALCRKSSLFKGAASSWIGRTDVEIDLVQSEFGEGEVYQEFAGSRSVAFALGASQKDSQFGVAVDPVDVVEPNIAEILLSLHGLHRENDATRAFDKALIPRVVLLFGDR